MRLVWTRRARDDLTDIALFIARDKPDAAFSWVERLEKRAEAILNAPRSYRMVPELERDDIREVLTGNYRTIFKIEKDRVVVLTVFEGHELLDAAAVDVENEE